MYFEGRELLPYGEPVDANDLRVGITYFSVSFLDDAMLIPLVEPLTYIGHNLEPEDVDLYYFQDTQSYLTGARYHKDQNEFGTINLLEKIHLAVSMILSMGWIFCSAAPCDVRERRDDPDVLYTAI